MRDSDEGELQKIGHRWVVCAAGRPALRSRQAHCFCFYTQKIQEIGGILLTSDDFESSSALVFPPSTSAMEGARGGGAAPALRVGRAGGVRGGELTLLQ
jgi:hypothetical protein